MIRREPPSIATWLLRHFESSPHHEAVVGDLVERFENGQSRLWYWRQTLLSIVISIVRQSWNNKWLALRALLTGWSALLFGIFFSRLVFTDFLAGASLDLVDALASWSRVLRPYLSRSWIAPTIISIFHITWCFVSGWLVGRLHREHKALVLLFTITVAAQVCLSLLSGFLYSPNNGIAPLALQTKGLPLAIVLNTITTTAIMAGGVFGLDILRRRSRNW